MIREFLKIQEVINSSKIEQHLSTCDKMINNFMKVNKLSESDGSVIILREFVSEKYNDVKTDVYESATSV